MTTLRTTRTADTGGRLDSYALYKAERGPLKWYLRSHGVGEHEAEDAIQAAFVRLLRAEGPIRDPRSWLRTVALNEYRRSCPSVPSSRRRAVVIPVSPAELPDHGGVESGESSPDPAELSEQAQWALDAIATLPDKQRQVMACHYDGQSTQQIADGLGMSHATVRQNLHRARRALSKQLRPKREDDT